MRSACSYFLFLECFHKWFIGNQPANQPVYHPLLPSSFLPSFLFFSFQLFISLGCKLSSLLVLLLLCCVCLYFRLRHFVFLNFPFDFFDDPLFIKNVIFTFHVSWELWCWSYWFLIAKHCAHKGYIAWCFKKFCWNLFCDLINSMFFATFYILIKIQFCGFWMTCSVSLLVLLGL